ncbi:Hypothetical_protein [Hexamita inflata]|uniref:Hypothetical_protein n=1 Tax=Hexamita inflata TaxID=28002 RepID=A0AA86QMY9_9EUKA|nr:Hypothetical protein HINF_LOCUS43644 [Hexamita inflata]
MKQVSYKPILSSHQKKPKNTQMLKQIYSYGNISQNTNKQNNSDEESFKIIESKTYSLLIGSSNENDTESFNASKNCQSFYNEPPKQNDLIYMQDILDIFDRL